ncbi:hypothetical protein ACYTX7_09650, partial [Streptococcus pyogenes]
NPNQMLSAQLPSDLTSPLWTVTLENLLQMQSGLPGIVPVTSLTYPNAQSQAVYDNAGSYASLAFAGPGPYPAPATPQQELNYFLYQ